MEIRKAQPTDDFDQIANIYVKSWQHAYQGIVPQVHLDGLTCLRWSDTLRNSPYTALVLLEGERYIGTSTLAPARDDRWKGFGEIVSIYLLPEAMGKGYGRALLEAGVRALCDMGFERMYLWVLEENRPARGFYRAMGWERSAERASIEIGGKALVEVRYTFKTRNSLIAVL